MKLATVALIAVVAISGCSGGASRVVGKWSGEIKPTSKTKALDGLAAGLASAILGKMTYEFNSEGKYKESAQLGTIEEGSYTISGNEVDLVSEKGKKSTLVLDGETLSLKKDFDSDPTLVMKREASDSP